MMKKLVTAALFAACFSAGAETLRIGIEGAYPPFSTVNEKNELVGFDIDIANALCKEMQAECELVKIDWDGLIPSLLNERIDFAVASMSATDERKKTVDFTNKYYSNNGQLALRAEEAAKVTEANLLEYLKGKRIGVQTSTIHDYYATAKFSDIAASIERYNTQDEVNLDLVAGRLDATLADQTALASGFLKTEMGKEFAFAAPLFNEPQFYGEGVSIPVRKGDDKLRERLNAAIKAIRENGEYQKINSQYFDFDIY